MFKKKKLIIIVICAGLLLVGGVLAALYFTNDNNNANNAQPGSIEWKKQQYSEICERGVSQGLETNTTEYSICTRDLGYRIKAIEPASTQEETYDNENNPSASPGVNDNQSQEAKRAGCISLRATNLNDLIKSNEQNGISESDTRISYQTGIAQCDADGL